MNNDWQCVPDCPYVCGDCPDDCKFSTFPLNNKNSNPGAVYTERSEGN